MTTPTPPPARAKRSKRRNPIAEIEAAMRELEFQRIEREGGPIGRIIVEAILDGKRAPFALSPWMDLSTFIVAAVRAYVENYPMPKRIEKRLLAVIAEADRMATP